MTFNDFLSGVWERYCQARDSAGWAWSEAQSAAKEHWSGASKAQQAKQTLDQATTAAWERWLHARAAAGATWDELQVWLPGGVGLP